MSRAAVPRQRSMTTWRLFGVIAAVAIIALPVKAFHTLKKCESAFGSRRSISAPSASADNVAAAGDDLSKLTVPQLRDKLKEANLPVGVTKQDLIDRCIDRDLDDVAVAGDDLSKLTMAKLYVLLKGANIPVSVRKQDLIDRLKDHKSSIEASGRGGAEQEDMSETLSEDYDQKESAEISWSRGGRQFASSREVYTRSLYRVCLKSTTSEDEDVGKPEPAATAYWTLYGRNTTIGNGVPNSQRPDDICRRMDDSMSGPSAGIVRCITDDDGEQAALYALRAGMTCGWQIMGERGDAAVRVGKAKVYSKQAQDGSGTMKEARILTLDADRWALCDGASFAAGNSVFDVEEVNEKEQELTIHCSKGPLRNKSIKVTARQCPFVFGRAHEADLCIIDKELSEKHGVILYMRPQGRKNGVFVLADLEGTNGSYMRLTGPYSHNGVGALTIGDEFIVGRTGFSVNRFDCGISEDIGNRRDSMEDRTVVIQNLMYPPPEYHYNGSPKETLTELAFTTFAAVFDGHWGKACSNYLVDALPRHVRDQMLTEGEALRQSIENDRGPRRLHTDSGEDATPEIMRCILKTAYLRADEEFMSFDTTDGGSTAATVILFGRRLFAANVGDSRVLLAGKNGACLKLTSDHQPSRLDEAARVREAGGFISNNRVIGELAITRAFGDKSFKMGIKTMLERHRNPEWFESMLKRDADKVGGAGSVSDDPTSGVIAEPEIASIALSHDDEFLLLACDGLFEVFKSQEAITFARQELIAHRGEPAKVARILSDQAIRVRGSEDNVSIIIIVLRPFWEDEAN